MARYRLYSLDQHGRIGFAEGISANGDREAVSMAQAAKPDAVQLEVWDGRRLVADLKGRKPAHISEPSLAF